MVRLTAVALFVLWLPATAWSNPPVADTSQDRNSYVLQSSAHRHYAPEGPIGRAEVAPNAHVGFGMFGMKSERTYLQPVTGREIDAPKQRRAAVGFSLKF